MAATLAIGVVMSCLFILIDFLCYYSVYSIIIRTFAAVNKNVRSMTAVELNAQIWRDMAEIADSEPLMKQLAKYLKRLVAKKQDETLMTKEEFFRRVDEAREEIRQGKGIRMLPNETLDEFLRRVG